MAPCCTVLKIKLKNIFVTEIYSLYLISPIKLSPAEVLTVAWFRPGSICHGFMLSVLLSGLKFRLQNN